MKKKYILKKRGSFLSFLILFIISLCNLINKTVSIQCERIMHPACTGLGYNTTAMPNLAGHQSQTDAENLIEQLLPLLNSHCSKHARFLLCASMFPLCSPDVPRPVSACRTVCETVKNECTIDPVLKLLWPKFIDCEALPQPDQTELCIQVPKENDTITNGQNNKLFPPLTPLILSSSSHHQHELHQPSSGSNHYKSILSSAPSSSSSKTILQQFWPWAPAVWKNGYMLRNNNNNNNQNNNNNNINNNNIGIGGNLIGNSLQILCPINFTLSQIYNHNQGNGDGDGGTGNVLDGHITTTSTIVSKCIRQCGMDGLFTSAQKYFTRKWILCLSAVCFILTLFSLVTFWAEPMRFGYPERPVLFLALCYNLLSICYLERIIFHNAIQEGIYDEFTVGCQTSPPCLASYISTSYLILSAATWWLIFSLCWYLSTKKQWSPEALEKKSGLFHVLAWVPPLAPPIGALLWGAVKPQELTGMCTAYGFVEIPAFILLVAGAVLSIMASKSLRGLSQSVNDDSYNRRFLQVRIRIILFSCVFFIPQILSVILAFFEETNYMAVIEPCIRMTQENCDGPQQYTPFPTIIRLFCMLAGGSMAGMWVWSKKTCESYRTRISTTTTTTPATSTSTTTTPSSFSTITNTKYCNSMMKKPKSQIGPLYAGINFHNVPVCHIVNNNNNNNSSYGGSNFQNINNNSITNGSGISSSAA